MRRVLLWTVAFAAAVPTTARAEGLPRRPTSVSAVADAAARAATAHDRARLDALASADGPDPWVVALALVGDDRADAAAAWAGAGRGPGFHGLAVFVASLPDDPVTARAAAAARVAFDAAEDADPVAAAAALAVPAVRASRVLSAYATWVSARATQATTRAPGDASALAEAAETARRVGWLRLEAVCLHAAGATFVAVGRPALALAPWERRVVVERLRGRAEDELAAHLDLAAAGWSLEQLRTTRAHARAALELAQRLGRRADAARALARLGEADVAAGDVETGTGRLLLAVRELAALGDAQDAARTEAGLGLAHATAGSLGEAARRLDDACTALGGDDGVAAEDVGALDACGRLALATGDTGRARQILSALRARRARDDDPAELARAEEGLATAARLGGDLEAAVAGYRRAAAAYARAGCVRGSERSVLLAADAAGAAGRPAEAQAAAERALREDGPADPAARAEALAVLARALEAQDRPTEALATWRLARAAAAAAGRSERATEALAGEARAALAAGRPDEALAAAATALDELDGRTAELPDADALRVRAAWACVHEVGVAAARATDDAAAVARFVDAGLAASLRASLSARGALREAAVPPAVRRAEDAALEARAEAAEALQRARAAQDQRAARAAQAALEDAQRRLAAAADHGEREARAAAAASWASMGSRMSRTS